MSAPRISVIVPCYNAARFVAETIASVSAQTEGDFEIVAVDNNSTDDTRAILCRLAAFEVRLRIIEEKVQGLSAARNAGIRAARGEFIALLDADDVWDRDYLAAHVGNLMKTGADISYAALRFIDTSSRPTGGETRPPMSGIGPELLLRSNPCTAMVVVRRQIFEKAGLFDTTLKRVEDQEWLFRAAVTGARFAGINRALAGYRITPGGLSADLEAMRAAHETMLQRAAVVAPNLVERHQRIARAAMLRYCARRAMEHASGEAVARDYLQRMWRLAPDLAVREPLITLKAVAVVCLPRLVQAVRGGGAVAKKGAA